MKYCINIICLIIITSFLIGSTLCRAEYDYIDITDPFLRKIPIAIPKFVAVSGSQAEANVSEKASNLLSETLEFTGYFKMLDRSALPVDLQSVTVARDINFRNLTGIGAELLVTGGILVRGDMVEMELRLYDTFKGQLLVGKRYKGWIIDQREMILRFCSEIIYHLTGKGGIFDSKIAFVSTGSGNTEIYISEFDGYNPRRFTNKESITLFPAWSSDAKWIAYTSYVEGKPDLYIKSLKGKDAAVVSKEGINISPAWVPGRFELAATLSFSGDQEIYLLTGSGKIIKRLIDEWGIDGEPTWSPDGEKMAFVSRRSGTPQIFIKDLDTGQVRRLTFYGRYNTQPSWSTVGDRIAFTGRKGGQSNIYVIDIDGKGQFQLTHDAGNNESPSWSPDGNLIVFSSTREGTSRIYVMNADGTNQRRLFVMPGRQKSPSWSPGAVNKRPLQNAHF